MKYRFPNVTEINGVLGSIEPLKALTDAEIFSALSRVDSNPATLPFILVELGLSAMGYRCLLRDACADEEEAGVERAGEETVIRKFLARHNYCSGEVLNSITASSASPRVSLYVPCYQGERYLAETLAAIRAQTFPVSELLLVDDGSSDGSAQVAKKFGFNVITHNENLGLGRARNSAIANCTGEVIASVDADTTPHPFWLEEMLKPLSSGADAVTGRLIERNSCTVPDRYRSVILKQHYGSERIEGIKLFSCNTVIKREVFARIGGYDPSLRTSYDDIELSDRMIAAGLNIVYQPRAYCWHQRTDSLGSILETTFNWRRPSFERQGVYRDPSKLLSKWAISFPHDMNELIDLASGGRPSLAAISLLNTLYGFLRDAELLQHPNATAGSALQQGTLSLILRGITLSSTFSDSLKDNLVEIFLRLCNSRGVSLSLPVQEIVNAKEFSAWLSIWTQHFGGNFDQSIQSLLEIGMAELPRMLSFPRQFADLIEEGIKRLSLDIICDNLVTSLPGSAVQFDTFSRKDLQFLSPSAERLSPSEWLEMIAGVMRERELTVVVDRSESDALWWILKLAERVWPKSFRVRGFSNELIAALRHELRHLSDLLLAQLVFD